MLEIIKSNRDVLSATATREASATPRLCEEQSADVGHVHGWLVTTRQARLRLRDMPVKEVTDLKMLTATSAKEWLYVLTPPCYQQ